MRLIEADELMDFISEHAEQIQYAIEHKDMEILESLIKQIPTVYNIEKVVEELKNEKKLWNDATYNKEIGKQKARSYEHAIEIVKGGGLDGVHIRN